MSNISNSLLRLLRSGLFLYLLPYVVSFPIQSYTSHKEHYRSKKNKWGDSVEHKAPYFGKLLCSHVIDYDIDRKP